MNRQRHSWLAAALVVAAPPALAQEADLSFMKGRVKPGLYEQTTTSDMTGLPGVPKGQEKYSDTRQRCVTQAEVDKGMELAPGCAVKSRNVTSASAQFIAECRDGATHEMRIDTSATGFTSDMKTTGKQPDGKPFAMSMRSESRYLGPCKN